MKKILLIVISILLLTGCSSEYKVHNKKIKFDQRVEFRHLKYKTSTTFDYGSDGEFRYYNLYDKKQNTIYSVTIEKIKGSYEEDKKKIESDSKNQKVKGEEKKKYYLLTYIKDEKKYHTYYFTYDKNEYYKIQFYNVVDSSIDFENKFISYISFSK